MRMVHHVCMDRFRRVERDQPFLLPPDMREWLSPDHFAFFLVEAVDQFDLSAFEAAYSTDRRGRKAFHPSVLVGVILYGSAVGVTSCRALERACWVDVGFRVVSANCQPDHTTIAKFLGRHGDALKGLFVQVLALAAEAGVLRARTVAVDGTKIGAAAARSANTDVERLREEFAGWDTAAGRSGGEEGPAEQRLGDEFEEWVVEVHRNDEADDDTDDGSGPIEEVKDPARRREWIRDRLRERVDAGGDSKGRVNRTDPDSGLMPVRGGGFIQGYNAQAVADEGGIVVATAVADGPNDHFWLVPMTEAACANLAAVGVEAPETVLGDAGYWSPSVADVATRDDLPDPLVIPDRWLPTTPPEPLPEVNNPGPTEDEILAVRVAVLEQYRNGEINQKQGAVELGVGPARFSELWRAWRDGGPDAIRRRRRSNGEGPRPRPPTPDALARHAMRTRLADPDTAQTYKRRSAMIEPVFAQTKHNRGIRAFRRVTRLKAEIDWAITTTAGNLVRIHNTANT